MYLRWSFCIGVMGSVLRHGTQRSWGRRGWLGPGVRGHPDLRGRHRDTSLALSRLHPVTAARRAQRLPSSPCPWPGLGHRPRSGSGKPPGRHRVSTEAGRRGHERQQHRHLPAAKAELVTAMARERRREQGDTRMSLRGRSVQTPRTGGRLAFLG